MTLGKKIVTLFLLLGLSFTIGSYATLRLSVIPAFSSFERDAAEGALTRVTQLLNADLDELEIINREYSWWDDTYQYALGKNSEFEDENLDPVYWHELNIQLLLLFDIEGNQLYGRLSRQSDGGELPLHEPMIQPLAPDHPLATHQSEDHVLSGFLRTRVGLMQVVSRPILHNDGGGPVVGSIAIGRFLSDQQSTELGMQTGAEVSIYPASENEKFPRAAAAFQNLSTADIDPDLGANSDYVSEYQLFSDIFGAPAAALEVRIPRAISRVGTNTVRTATLLLAAASAVFLLAAWVFLQKMIIGPVKILTEQMLRMRHTGNLSIGVSTKRSDEIGVLSGEFGELTSKLSEARQESESARDEAIAMSKTKTEFLARMSHEIRTPMNGVLGMTELIQNTALNSTQKRFAQTIYESAESLLVIINDILDFSKIEAGKLRLELLDVDLHTLLDETVDALANMAHSKGLELVNISPSQLNTTVKTDPLRLRQVLTNLVGNAIKFTEKGEVVLRVSTSEGDDETLDVAFEIKDTGIGIKQEKQEDIFDSFTQEDDTTTRLYGGTGLGLSICKQIVDSMGGDLTVESVSGRGSTFSFSLIMAKGSDAKLPASTPLQFVAGKKVLVVDDNATNREILESQMLGWKATTNSAESASHALRSLEAAVASGAPYDLGILDMHMPVTDGLELARSIRDNPDLVNLKLIMLSSVATPASDEILRELNIGGQLSKPIRQSQLYNSLASVLGGRAVIRGHSNLNSAATKALSGRILLAEDNAVNQAVATGMLESMGLSVTVASNGREAIELFRHNTFDLVLMDCQMPDVDGFQATQAIRTLELESASRPTPIVAATANALASDRERCLKAGMDDHVKKPFTIEQLHAALSLYLLPNSGDRTAEGNRELIDDKPSSDRLVAGSPVDREVLDVLSRLQQPGAPSLVHKVITAYLDGSEKLRIKLGIAIDDANGESVRDCAHALKSSSANVGALALAELCKRLEVMGRENDLTDACRAFEQFAEEYSRVVSALRLEARSAAA